MSDGRQSLSLSGRPLVLSGGDGPARATEESRTATKEQPMKYSTILAAALISVAGHAYAADNDHYSDEALADTSESCDAQAADCAADDENAVVVSNESDDESAIDQGSDDESAQSDDDGSDDHADQSDDDGDHGAGDDNGGEGSDD